MPQRSATASHSAVASTLVATPTVSNNSKRGMTFVAITMRSVVTAMATIVANELGPE